MPVVVARSGSWSEGAVAHSLKDDAGEPIGPPDFGRGVYAELVGLYTSPSDWVLNLSIQSGKYSCFYLCFECLS